MAEIKMTQPEQALERNLAMTTEVMRYLLANPNALDKLPDQFELIVLPENDPVMWLYNMRLLEKSTNEGKSIVFALLGQGKNTLHADVPARFFAPVEI